MTEAPLLTICIPTYNRAVFLQECLESVVLSAQGCEDQIRVLISDNASADDTRERVQSFMQRYPWIAYHRHETNIGGAENFYSLAVRAQTEYIWLLGDDDRLTPDAIPAILAKLTQGFDLVLCNYASFDREFRVQHAARRFPLQDDQVFADPGALMETFTVHLGYISIQIVRRSVFLAAPQAEYDSFIPYGHSVMYVVYYGLWPQSRTAFIAKPIVHNRGENSGGFAWYQFFAVGPARVLDALEKRGYPRPAILTGKRGALRDLVLPRILLEKRDGKNQPGLFGLLRPCYGAVSQFWTRCVPALLVPGWFVPTVDRWVFLPRRRARQQTESAP